MIDSSLLPTSALLYGALFIFALRVIGVALSTLRVLAMMRSHKVMSAVFGFFEVFVYVIALGRVVNNLDNYWNILGYCLGFSAGTVLGMWLDEKFVSGFANVRLVSRSHGQVVADALREAGYGATLEVGAGREGPVGIVMTTVRRREVPQVQQLADALDPAAFVTVEEARTVRRGYLHRAQRER